MGTVAVGGGVARRIRGGYQTVAPVGVGCGVCDLPGEIQMGDGDGGIIAVGIVGVGILKTCFGGCCFTL